MKILPCVAFIGDSHFGELIMFGGQTTEKTIHFVVDYFFPLLLLYHFLL